MTSWASVAWCVACALSRHSTCSASVTTLDFQSLASLLSRRTCARPSSSWTKWLSRSARTYSSCASRWASCAHRYDTWSLGDGIAALCATACANCSCWTLPWLATWATIRRHLSCCWIRLLIQFDTLSWKPRMKGDMSNAWTLETIPLGIGFKLECGMSLSSWRVACLDQASTQWSQAASQVYQMHSLLVCCSTRAIMSRDTRASIVLHGLCTLYMTPWTMTQKNYGNIGFGTPWNIQQLEIPKVGQSGSISKTIFDPVGARWATHYLSIVFVWPFLPIFLQFYALGVCMLV